MIEQCFHITVTQALDYRLHFPLIVLRYSTLHFHKMKIKRILSHSIHHRKMTRDSILNPTTVSNFHSLLPVMTKTDKNNDLVKKSSKIILLLTSTCFFVVGYQLLESNSELGSSINRTVKDSVILASNQYPEPKHSQNTIQNSQKLIRPKSPVEFAEPDTKPSHVPYVLQCEKPVETMTIITGNSEIYCTKLALFSDASRPRIKSSQGSLGQ